LLALNSITLTFEAEGAIVNCASASVGAGPRAGSYFWQATSAKPILSMLSNNVFMVLDFLD
jgi:hypothetical protein